VVGVPDVDFGERAVGVLVVDPDFELDSTALQRQLRETLAPFKVPKAYVVVDELPRNSMGKIQKAALRSDERLMTWSRQP
jgi:malonyl-CoA/methylmalonyl-CoA synthetase